MKLRAATQASVALSLVDTASPAMPEGPALPTGSSTVMAWTTVGILLIASAMSSVDRQIIALLVEPIRKAFGVSDLQVGLLYGLAFGLFYALFGLPIGWLVDRYPRRLIISAGMTCWSLASAACGMAGTYWHLLAARFGVGMGEAALAPAAYSMIADLFPPRRWGLALGVFITGASIGSALAFMGGGALIARLEAIGPVSVPLIGALQPWQMVFVITGLPGVAVALLVLALPEPERRQLMPQRGEASGFVDYLQGHRRYYACHFIGFGLVTILTYGSAAWMPAMLMRRFHVGVAEAGLLLGAISVVSAIPGSIFGGWIADRWFAGGARDAHLRYYAYACLGSAALAAVTFFVAGSLVLVLAGYAILHFFHPFTGPAAAHLQLATPNEFRGRASALFVMVFNLMGMCLGPPLVAVFTDYLFCDPARLSASLGVMYVGVALLAALVFAIGLPAARAIVMEREQP